MSSPAGEPGLFNRQDRFRRNKSTRSGLSRTVRRWGDSDEIGKDDFGRCCAYGRRPGGVGPAQALTGTVTTIDRITGTIAIQQTQSGTVGSNAGGATEQFKIPAGMLETLHAGDKVTFTVNESGPTKTVTKIEKQ